MRLKNILFEDTDFGWIEDLGLDREKLFEKIDRIVNSGNYIIKRPFLYRGRDFDDWVKVKDTEKYDSRPPQDTDLVHDYIIHEYNKNCYPKHPDRRQARFSSTSKDEVGVYGSRIYVILPQKNAQIAASKTEPYQTFVEGQQRALVNGLKTLWKFTTDPPKKEPEFKRAEEKISDEVYSLIEDLFEIYAWAGQEEIPLASKYGCPKKVSEKLENEKEKFKRFGRVYDGIESIEVYYDDVILEYFGNYELGYPSNENMGKGEVIFQGGYAQIQYGIWKAYLHEKELL